MCQIRQFPKYLGTLLLRICAAILAGTLLLTLFCMIPSAPMNENLVQSAPVFQEEGVYPDLFSWCTSKLDSTTDALILMISAFDSSQNPLVHAMSGTYYTLSSEETISNALIAHYGAGIPFDGSTPYYHYWHGYQLFIRPLLSVFNYSEIRILNGVLQAAVLLILCILLCRNHLHRYVLPLLVSVLMLMPVALAKSLQFSPCYYIMMLGCIALLIKKEQMHRINGILFLYIGIATAYFDFLTYPVVTLGIPAVLYFVMCGDCDFRNTFCRGVKICFSWGLGYGLMWAGKWLIGSLILQKNILSVASDNFVERSSANSNLVKNLRAALGANIKQFLHTPATAVVFLLAGILLILLVLRLRSKKISLQQVVTVFFPFAILAIIPFAWYAVSSQHALVHYWFTNKCLMLSVFAGLCALTKATQKSI